MFHWFTVLVPQESLEIAIKVGDGEALHEKACPNPRLLGCVKKQVGHLSCRTHNSMESFWSVTDETSWKVDKCVFVLFLFVVWIWVVHHEFLGVKVVPETPLLPRACSHPRQLACREKIRRTFARREICHAWSVHLVALRKQEPSPPPPRLPPPPLPPPLKATWHSSSLASYG